MSDAINTNTLDKFTGVNIRDNPVRLSPEIQDRQYAWPLAVAKNVRIDNTGMITQREGYERDIVGTTIHSLWSEDKCFFVDGNILYQILDTDLDVVSVKTDMELNARVSYATFNLRVYFTNQFQIGYIENHVANALIDPDIEFKLPLPPGRFIEVFMGCIYVARKNILYISDPLCDYYDTRYGYKQFANDITMIRAVDNGIYVSDDRIWFCQGKGQDEFIRTEVYPSKAIPYTDLTAPGDYIGNDVTGKVAIWTSEDGVCFGNKDGAVTGITRDRFVMPPASQGSCLIRDDGRAKYYINTLF